MYFIQLGVESFLHRFFHIKLISESDSLVVLGTVTDRYDASLILRSMASQKSPLYQLSIFSFELFERFQTSHWLLQLPQ
jgi:hypothetical protein